MTAARKLFFRYGIRKVTVEEICAEANVSKMTFYKFFPNKTKLAETMLTEIFDENERVFRELMDADMPFSEKMEILVQRKLDTGKDAGMQFIAELYQTSDSEIATYLRANIRERMKNTLKEFAKAQEKGWMRKDIKPELLMIIFDKMQEIAGDERILKAYDNVEDMTREIANFFIYGISNER